MSASYNLTALRISGLLKLCFATPFGDAKCNSEAAKNWLDKSYALAYGGGNCAMAHPQTQKIKKCINSIRQGGVARASI